ncbi:MAG: tungsten formylmethanofuran dehydrogenase [Calditrichaeota bacterium]|nr:dehydrogenase E1 component subunit alpha/beta [Calditrichota bacterium]RQV98833.1 MAG: tungsten formylmethanofuran dehydrogenase [Calditrichota bacterium]
MTKFKGFTKKELLEFYRNMLLSRKSDDKQLTLLRQGKVHFHIGGSGHEAAQVAAVRNFKPNSDWAYCYYRDQAFVMGWGMTVEEVFLHSLAKADDPNSGGRQIPHHWGHSGLRIVSKSSCTGVQFLQATGTALGVVKAGTDEVVYVSAGEGTTSEGEFFEALNWAGRDKLPVIFHIEDNKYAISVHVSEQTAGGSVYKVVAGFENLEREIINGTDFFESYKTFQKAVKRARAGEGPTIIVSEVVRLLPHSSSDDHRKYRTPEELEEDRQKDPILQFALACTENGIIESEEFDKIQQEVKNRVDKAAEWAMEQPDPEADTAADYVFVENRSPQKPAAPAKEGERAVMVDAINHALHEEMDRDEKIVVYGEDVADPKGGVFTATKGLTQKFGKDRAFNSPLAEASIVGTAIGLAVYGYKPVVEIQFMDYIWPAFMQIRNELAAMYYRSNGTWKAPVVIRTPVGGYIHGGLYHSQTAEAIFAHTPGLKVFYPSNAADAKGLLKAAIRGEDPVIFCEHKGLYRQGFAARPEPDKDYICPPGHAAIIQKGEDVTLITWGLQVQRSIEAVRLLGELQPSVEIIDIRTMIPLDMETILESVRKTGKVLIVHEDNFTGGFGGEIAARIVSQAFEYLDGPIERVAARDSHIPYQTDLENYILPTPTRIAKTLEKLVKY